MGKRTDNFEKLVRPVAGVADADRAAILNALRRRADLLESSIAPRVRDAIKAKAGMPDYDIAFQKKMGPGFSGWLKKAKQTAAGAPRHGMTDTGLANLHVYTTSDAKWSAYPLNDALRSRDPKRIADVQAQTLSLNAALARLPDYVGVVKRGTDLTAEQIALHVPGRIVTKEAFTSTSTGPGFPGDVHFVIHSRHGKKIAPYSAYPKEGEVLFAAGTRFEVLEVERKAGLTTITMKEVE